MGLEKRSCEAGAGRQHLGEDRSVELRGGETVVRHGRRNWPDPVENDLGWYGEDVCSTEKLAHLGIVLGFTEQGTIGKTSW